MFVVVLAHVLRKDDSAPPTLPPIFLSYNWGHQKQVELLRQHLALSGYASWMDVEQMYGGIELYDKIDAGITAAKVVVCCISKKYAASDNCKIEVRV